MQDNTHDSSGFMSGFMLGLLLGAAGSHYLTNTDEGKKIMDNLKDKATDALSSVKNNPALAAKLSELEKTMEAAKATLHTAAQHVADTTASPTETTIRKELVAKKSFFQKMGVSLGK